ncbi:MAG: hypothetical protein IT384_26285 [Deltaproteobacteria bacterium]|nr:hypothetical protein [Deltaproteobacteria bacterium]
MQPVSHAQLTALAALAAVISACGSSAETVITLPEGTDQRAAVVVIAGEHEAQVVSLDLEAGAPVTFQVLDGRSALTLILYQSSLARLGLPSGVLPLAETADASRTIPRSTRLFSSEVESGRVEPWSPLGSLPDAIRDLRIAAPTLAECAQRGGCLVPSPEDPSDARICVEACPEPPVPEAPAMPEPPAPPALPVFTPCPAGWMEIIEAGVAVCEPPPSIATATCTSPDVQRYDASACSALMPCPLGEWPEDLPPSLPRAYVRSGALGGDGSAGAPFGNIGAAVASGSGEQVIVVARGTYPEVLDLSSRVQVYGACPSEVIVDGGSSAQPVVTIRGVQVVLHGVSIVGGSGGIRVEDGGRATIDATLDRGGAGHGLDAIGSIVTADRLAIIGRGDVAVRAQAGADVSFNDGVIEAVGVALVLEGSTGSVSRTVVRGQAGARGGVSLSAGAELRLERVSLKRSASPALNVTSGSRLIAEDVAIDQPRATNGDVAQAVSVQESGVELRRVVIRDAVGQGVTLSGPVTTATISETVIQRVQSSLSGDPGRAVLVRDRARGSFERLRLQDTAGESVLMVDQTEVSAANVLASRAGQTTMTSCFVAYASHLVLRGAVASACTDQGVVAAEAARLDAEDLTVQDASYGVTFNRASGRLVRAHLLRVEEAGLSVVDGGHAVVSDLRVEDSVGLGLFVFRAMGVEVSRAQILGGTPPAVTISGPTTVAGTATVTDLDLSWNEPLVALFDRGSLFVSTPARLSRVAINGAPGTALTVEAKASVIIEDLRVFAPLGRGAHVHEQGKLSLRRAQIHRAGCNGLLVEDSGAVDGRDLEIDQTLGQAVAGCVLGGTNLYVGESGRSTIERFRFADALVTGAVVTDVAQVALSQGEIAGQPDGAVVTSQAQSVEALLDRVRYGQATRALVIDR